MSKTSRIEEEVKYSGNKKKQKSPTSINMVETAKLSDAEFFPFDDNENDYIFEYMFEFHGSVCPNYKKIYYEEIKEDITSVQYVASSKIGNMKKMIDFIENKCTNYRFVVSILTITFYVIDDITNDEITELKGSYRNNLLQFYYEKRLIPANINIDDDDNSFSHSNAILIDRELKQVERFEPHGFDTFMVSDNMDYLLKKSFDKIGYKYFNPNTFCPLKSVQRIHNEANNPLYKDLGYCTIWSLWYIDTRLLNPEKSRDETVGMITDMIKHNDEKFIHETIHFYWTNLLRYIELRSDNNSPNEAIEIMYRKSISQLGEKLLGKKRAITKYYKKPENNSILSRLLGYVQK